MSKTVDRNFGTISCECDNCGETAEIEFDDTPNFKACQNELNKSGWTTAQIDGEWKDFCSEKCAEKFKKDLREGK